MDRSPAVAGRFYPAHANKLMEQLARYSVVSSGHDVGEALAVIVPHAGYMFSGGTAGKVFAQVDVPRRVIIVAPNHTGLGHPLAIMNSGRWLMPMGAVHVDTVLADAICNALPEVQVDPVAHMHEHAAEVQVPFLQYHRPGVRIVPFVVSRVSWETCQAVGKALADVIRRQPSDDPVAMVASTDMSHYVSAEEAAARDHLAIERIEALDPKGLFDVVHENDISMCGVISTVIVLIAAISLGATAARLVEYTHSGVVSGDYHRVVGYAGLVVT